MTKCTCFNEKEIFVLLTCVFVFYLDVALTC